MTFSLAQLDDRIRLTLDGKTVYIAQSYDVHTSVFAQPARFTIKLGNGDTAAELLKTYKAGTPFQLSLYKTSDNADGSIILQTGRVTYVGSSGDAGTTLEIRGEDRMQYLFRSHVEQEQHFAKKSYWDITIDALKACGAPDATNLFAGNGANRAAVTGVKTLAAPPPNAVREQQVDALTGTSRTVYNTIKAEFGQTWMDFLLRQYKLAGLFLWTSGEGQFLLGQPDGTLPATFQIIRRRGQTREQCNIRNWNYRNGFLTRRGKCIAYGKGGARKSAKDRIRGEWPDPEALALGFDDVVTLHDPDIRTSKEATYLARREIAERIRDDFSLEYTLSGHRTKCISKDAPPDSFATWAPDTICRVDDEELGIKGNFYVSEVTFTRNSGDGTSTLVHLMKPESLVFAENLFKATK